MFGNLTNRLGRSGATALSGQGKCVADLCDLDPAVVMTIALSGVPLSPSVVEMLLAAGREPEEQEDVSEASPGAEGA